MRIAEEKKKNAIVQVSMTKLEKEILQNMAKRAGCTVSELVRQVLVYQAIDLPEAPLGETGRLTPLEVRDDSIRVQVSTDEKRALKERAESLGCSMSDLVRRSAIQGEVVKQNDLSIEAINKIRHELRKQGTNLNQLMYFINANGMAAYDSEEVKETARCVRDGVRQTSRLIEELEKGL